MTLTEHDLSELLAAVQGGEITETVRTSLAWVLQQLIEAELTAAIGAAPGQRAEGRTAQRNGHRPKLITTAAGDVEVGIPKLRTGIFFPSILERRRRIDRALFAVVMEAYVHGVSTRKVDNLIRAMGGAAGISKSEVSRICAELDDSLEAFRTRPLEGGFPYIFADATYIKARVRSRVVSRAVVIATGVKADGTREVLGIDIGDSESGAFWTAFFRSLRARGLAGAQLVISDHHAGLKAAIASVFIGAALQRCRVHFVRNALARVPKGSNEMVAAAIRTIFSPLPPSALEEDLVVEPPRAAQRGDQRRTNVVGIFLRVPLERIRCFGGGCCKAPEGPRVTRNLSVELSGSDLVRASPLGSLRWPRDLIAA